MPLEPKRMAADQGVGEGTLSEMYHRYMDRVVRGGDTLGSELEAIERRLAEKTADELLEEGAELAASGVLKMLLRARFCFDMLVHESDMSVSRCVERGPRLNREILEAAGRLARCHEHLTKLAESRLRTKRLENLHARGERILRIVPSTQDLPQAESSA